MIDNLINEIEQAMLPVLDNEQLGQLRKVLEYTFRNVAVTEKESITTESSNQALIENFVAAKRWKDALTSPYLITRAPSIMHS